MSRYIDADRLKKKKKYCFQTNFGAFPKHEYFIKLQDLLEAPTADVEEVRRGKWVTITIPRHDPHGEKFLLCTNCERAWRKELLVDVASGDFPKRCPECGAHMSTEKEEK